MSIGMAFVLNACDEPGDNDEQSGEALGVTSPVSPKNEFVKKQYCSDYTNESGCILAGCKWQGYCWLMGVWDESPDCRKNTQEDCEAVMKPCAWLDNAGYCHGDRSGCKFSADKKSCEGQACSWVTQCT